MTSFLTLLLIQFLRHPTCTISQLPLQAQGLMRGSSSVASSHRQILHCPVRTSCGAWYTSLFNSRWEVYFNLLSPLESMTSMIKYSTLPSLT